MSGGQRGRMGRWLSVSMYSAHERGEGGRVGDGRDKGRRGEED